jgi:hypothetical protein
VSGVSEHRKTLEADAEATPWWLQPWGKHEGEFRKKNVPLRIIPNREMPSEFRAPHTKSRRAVSARHK